MLAFITEVLHVSFKHKLFLMLLPKKKKKRNKPLQHCLRQPPASCLSQFASPPPAPPLPSLTPPLPSAAAWCCWSPPEPLGAPTRSPPEPPEAGGMRSVSYVQRVALDFGGSLFPHAICLGDADNDTVRGGGVRGEGSGGRPARVSRGWV